MNTKVMFSSATPEWATPPELFEELDREFHFTLDACAADWNAKCPGFFTKKDDGLSQDWGREVVFCNPPYGREIGHWVHKAWRSAKAGALVVLLIPARTDTRWWHDYVMQGGEVRFLRGRVKFISPDGVKAGAPFPSAVVVFRPGEGPRAPAAPSEDK